MKKILIIFGVLFLSGAAVAVAMNEGLSQYDKHYTWRYKMTVEIETPEGIKTGSAVRQVDIDWKAIDWSQINNEPQYSIKNKVSGEAVVVDLGGHGKLFTLIDDRAYYDAPRAFNLKKFEDVEALPIGHKAEFDASNYPGPLKIVTFKDINDPKSVELVMAWEKDKNGQYAMRENKLEELFGEDVSLQSITIEMTDDQVAWGLVDEYLPEVFNTQIKGNWKNLPYELKSKLYGLTRFKHGGPE